jgi:uncharacterized protein (DUF433 family)
MTFVKLFQAHENPGVILQALKDHGLVGIHGGRLHVRGTLQKVEDLIEREGLEGYYANSSINHPDTELGYGFNVALYSIEQAVEYVTKAYDKMHS